MNMKVLWLALSSFIIAASAQSTTLNVLQQIADSDAVTELAGELEADSWQLKKIEHTQTYRCPGCFDYEVTFTKYDFEAEREMVEVYTFRTSLRLGESDELDVVRI